VSHEVKLPSLGEDASEEATVSCWLAEEGDSVEEGADLVELTTDKAAFSVAAPAAGVLKEKCVAEGDGVTVGDILCLLDA
jgi:2-oxoglutarate dehydrogenase E2 component (dihydrolipoamide succinyltransferase)